MPLTPEALAAQIQRAAEQIEEAREKMHTAAERRSELMYRLYLEVGGVEAARLVGCNRVNVYRVTKGRPKRRQLPARA